MMGSDSTAAERLGAWTAASTLADAPEDARRIAVRCLVDLFAVGIAGGAHDVSAMARNLIFAEHGNGHASVFGSNRRATASGAALANGTAAHVFDFDDTCYAGVTHGTAVIGPAVLAVAEQIEASGDTLLAGFIAGSECAYVLGKATGNAPWFNGWWGTTIYGAIGAAAGAARVLGLGATQTTSAIALAAFGVGGNLAGLGTDAKPLTCGLAAADGVRAALLAAAGATGPAGIFEDGRGFAKLFNDGVFDASQLDQMGRVYSLIEPGIFIKPYPSCTATHAALEAMSILMETHNLGPDDIARVTCFVPKMVDVSLIYNRPESPQQAQFSMPYTVGCMLAHGSFGVTHLTGNTPDSDATAQAMCKVTMVRDDELTAQSFDEKIGPECARVLIETIDGATHEHFNSVAIGAPSKPMSDKALDDKFRSLAAHGGLDDADPLLGRIRSIDTLSNARDLMPQETATRETRP